MRDPSASPHDAKDAALKIIRAEHTAFDAALASLLRQLEAGETPNFAPDAGRLLRRLSTIATFMESFHHPKEDDYLFKALRERTREADAILARLQHEHATAPEDFRELRLALTGTPPEPFARPAQFTSLILRYAHSQVEHMRLENEVVLPLAERALRPADWETIATAFRANRDPAFGPVLRK